MKARSRRLEGRVIKINKAVECPGEARPRLAASSRTSRRRSAGSRASRSRARARSSRSCAWPPRAGSRTTPGLPTSASRRTSACSGRVPSEMPEGVPTPGPQGTVRLFEPGSWNPVAQGRRAVLFPGRQGALERDALRRADRRRRRASFRSSSPPDASSASSSPAIRPGASARSSITIPSRESRCTRGWRRGLASPTATGPRPRAAAATARCARSVVTTIRPDTVFIPYHWAGRKSANQLTISAQDPISKIPEYKVCAVRVRKADAPPEYAAALEPQQ